MAISIAAPRTRRIVHIPTLIDIFSILAGFLGSRARAIGASLPDPERLGSSSESWRGPRSIGLVHGGVGMP